MQKGALPMVEMSAGSEINGYKGLWFVNYRVNGGPSLQVTFDGSTGKFEKAIPELNPWIFGTSLGRRPCWCSRRRRSFWLLRLLTPGAQATRGNGA